MLCYTLLALFVITTAVWAVYSWTDYNKRYAQAPDFWGRGTTRTVEITLIRQDIENLACSSDLDVQGLHCAFRGDRQPFQAGNADERQILRPYNTVDHVLFLGAGLWSSPKLQRELPSKRFSVICDFHMLEAVKQADLRWSPKGKFSPLNRSVPAGTLSNCEIPKW